MKTLLLSALLAVSALQPACKGKSDSAQSDVKWPAQPADGTPVVAEFLSLEGTGDKAEAKLRLFNFADKDVKAVHMTLHYLDGTGKELKDFPWSAMAGSGLVDKKGTAEIKAGAFLPPETKTVKADLRRVEYSDGTKWEIKE